jgi:hypothetical protein
MERSFGTPRPRPGSGVQPIHPNGIGQDNHSGLGFAVSVKKLAEHRRLPKMPDDFAELSESERDTELADTMAEASMPMPPVVVSSGQRGRYAWFNFKGVDEEHAKALAKCFPEAWGKQKWKVGKDGSWTLKVEQKDKDFREQIVKAGKLRTDNFIASCQALAITDDEFLEGAKDEDSFVRCLWKSGIRIKTNGIEYHGDDLSYPYYVAHLCAFMINERASPLMVYDVERRMDEIGDLWARKFIYHALYDYCALSDADGVNLPDSLIAWCLKPEHHDPLSAAEILMRQKEMVESLARQGRRTNVEFISRHKDVVAEHFAEYLRQHHPERSVVEWQLRYAGSNVVQNWLDSVEARLK